MVGTTDHMFPLPTDPGTADPACGGTLVGERVVELDRERERVNAEYLAALGELAAGGLHEVDGAVSAAGWVAHRCEVSGARARSEVRTATGLRSMPHVAEALGDGGLCVAKVELLAKARAGVDAALFADHEEHLVATIAPLTVDHAAHAVRYWLACALAETEGDGDPGERLRERRRLHLSPTLDGTWKLDATLDPEVRARIKATIDGLLLLCRYHHHLVHEGGFTLTGLVSQGLEFRRPDGTLITSPRTAPPSLFHLPTTRPPSKPPPFTAA